MDTAERVERFARERRYILLASLITYAIWCGGYALRLNSHFATGSHPLLGMVMTVFGFAWGGCCIWLLTWFRRVRAHPETVAALNDEMTVRNRWHAQRASMWVLLVCLMAGLGVSEYVELDARVLLVVLTWVLVVSQLGFYLWYDRSE